MKAAFSNFRNINPPKNDFRQWICLVLLWIDFFHALYERGQSHNRSFNHKSDPLIKLVLAFSQDAG